MTTAYATVREADAWFGARDISEWADFETRERTAALLRASEWVDRTFVFAGAPAESSQAMAWPRTGVFDSDGREVRGTPAAVYEAVYTLALAMLDGDEAAEAAIGLGPAIARQKAGGIEISYAQEGRHTSRIARLLAPYLLQRDSRAIRRS